MFVRMYLACCSNKTLTRSHFQPWSCGLLLFSLFPEQTTDGLRKERPLDLPALGWKTRWLYGKAFQWICYLKVAKCCATALNFTNLCVSCFCFFCIALCLVSLPPFTHIRIQLVHGLPPSPQKPVNLDARAWNWFAKFLNRHTRKWSQRLKVTWISLFH